MRSSLLLLVGPVLVLAGFACGDSTTTPGASDPDGSAAPPATGTDASNDTSAPSKDAGKDVEEVSSEATEVEPNGGTPATAVGTMVLPGKMNGKIDPTNDSDIFSIQLAPGDFWEWTATPTSADLAPHVTVFDTDPAGLNPIVVGLAGAGSPATLQHFVLRTGSFVVAMRDARNVGAAGNKGGPTYGYGLVAKRKTPQPVAVTFPATKTGKLASLGSVDLYTFTGTSGKGFDIVIRAEQKAPPSTLDSRLSLYDLTANKAIITNDNGAGTTDSKVGSPDSFPSTYMVIVENEGKDATDLSYEIELKLRP